VLNVDLEHLGALAPVLQSALSDGLLDIAGVVLALGVIAGCVAWTANMTCRGLRAIRRLRRTWRSPDDLGDAEPTASREWAASLLEWLSRRGGKPSTP
jgi:hypothetical protein